MLLLFVSIFMPRLLAVRCKRIVRHRLIYYCRIWFRNMSNFPTLRTMPHAEPVYFTRYTLEPFPISHDNWHIRCFYFNVSHWLQCANFARSFLCNSAEQVIILRVIPAHLATTACLQPLATAAASSIVEAARHFEYSAMPDGKSPPF